MNPKEIWQLYDGVSTWQAFEQVHEFVKAEVFRVNPKDAVDQIYQFKPVVCNDHEYPEIRQALLRKAGQWEAWALRKYAEFARQEVERLDLLFQGG